MRFLQELGDEDCQNCEVIFAKAFLNCHPGARRDPWIGIAAVLRLDFVAIMVPGVRRDDVDWMHPFSKHFYNPSTNFFKAALSVLPLASSC